MINTQGFFDNPKEESKAVREILERRKEDVDQAVPIPQIKPEENVKPEPVLSETKPLVEEEEQDRYDEELISNIDSYLYIYMNTKNSASKKQIEEIRSQKGKKRAVAEGGDRIVESVTEAIESKRKKIKEALKALSNIEEIQRDCCINM